jgi:23S rRNA (guanosine2251-2'-O)-methyltransferase
MIVCAEDTLMPATVMLEGLLSVQAAIDTDSRSIAAIYLADDVPGRRAKRLERAARCRGRTVTRLPRADLDALTGGRRHGGIAAVAGPRRLTPLDTLLRSADRPFLAMLDGVQDPHNFGQAVRALYAAGADGVLVGPRDWAHATWAGAATVVARASAGASERIAMSVVDDVDGLVGRLRAVGIRVVCAEPRGAQAVYDADLTGPLLLVVGGERRGVSRPLVAAADQRVAVPYGRHFGAALDITSATAALAFEIARQRR